MASVAMINSRIDAKMPERPYSTDAKQQFLFESVFPISAIQMISYLPIFWHIGFIISIHQVQVGTAYSHFPETSIQSPSRESHTCGNPIALLIHNWRSRYLSEILSLVFGYLVSLSGKDLSEIDTTRFSLRMNAAVLKNVGCYRQILLMSMVCVMHGLMTQTGRSLSVLAWGIIL